MHFHAELFSCLMVTAMVYLWELVLVQAIGGPRLKSGSLVVVMDVLSPLSFWWGTALACLEKTLWNDLTSHLHAPLTVAKKPCMSFCRLALYYSAIIQRYASPNLK